MIKLIKRVWRRLRRRSLVIYHSSRRRVCLRLQKMERVLGRPLVYMDELTWRFLDALMRRVDRGGVSLIFCLALLVVGAYGLVNLVYWLLNIFFARYGLIPSLLGLVVLCGVFYAMLKLFARMLRWLITQLDRDPSR